MRAFVDGRSGYAYGTDLSEAGVAEVAGAARAAADAADPDEYGGLPDEFGATPVGGLALAGAAATGRPSARSSWRSRSSGRRARGRA